MAVCFVLAMPKVIVTDSIDQVGIDILSQVAHVDVRLKLSEAELVSIIGDYDAIMIRSGTRVTAAVVAAGSRLKVIGRAGVGVDNVDIPAATRAGIIVVNSPEGNTIAAAEHTLALMLSMSRYVAAANQSLKGGQWERQKFVGVEVYNKTLGIVGLGRIGAHLAHIARAMGMKILAYDPYLSTERAEQVGARLVELPTLFQSSDFISLHVPKTPDTANMINAQTLATMKRGVRIVNCARGGLIDEAALAAAIASGHVAGAALDVFAQEPLTDSPLLQLGKEMTVTPHLGASTEEAQINVAVDVAEQIRDVLLGLPARSAVNIPGLKPEVLQELKPYLDLAETLGNLVGQLAGDRVNQFEIRLQGDLAEKNGQPIIIAAMKGLLTLALQERVNYVNALIEAKERGIRVVETRDPSLKDYSSSIELIAHGPNGPRSVAGALIGGQEVRVIQIDGFPINVPPTANMLMTLHKDVPGLIGHIGTLLGTYNVNIASMQVGRKIIRGDAVMVLSLDDPLPDGVIEHILQVPGIRDAFVVSL
ncbi:MAG: phosphoglycerate dehydrogenase [Synechococcales cyanobacterium]